MNLFKQLALLFPLMLPSMINAQYICTTNNGTITITGYSGTGGAVIIPAKITGLPVTSIGADAFFLCTNLIVVTIPNGITAIGDDAFAGCTKLTSINIPNSVTKLGVQVFDGCTKLDSASVGTNVTVIANSDFYGCSSLASFTIPSHVTSIEDSAFANCTILQSIVIPNDVTSLGEESFLNCGKLSTVTLSTNLTRIATENFAYDNLSSINIPKSVVDIGGNAFIRNTNLTSVIIPDNVTGIGGYAFFDCSKIANLTLSTNLTIIQESTFSGCARLTSVVIPKNVASIADYAFYGCNISNLYCQGNAPALGFATFAYAPAGAKTYYWSGTQGWGPTYGPMPTVMWGITSVAFQSNQFSFNFTCTNHQVFLVETCTNLVNPVWQRLQTNVLNGTNYVFTDSQWSKYSHRFYRTISP